MKKFLLFSALFLLFSATFSACTEPLLHRSPKFRFGQKVYVSEGFYKGCSGYIIQYWEGYHSTNEIGYKIDATCSSVDGKYTHNEEMSFLEQDLVEDVSQ